MTDEMMSLLMRLPSEVELRRLPAGDLLLLRVLGRRHRAALDGLDEIDPANGACVEKARRTRHERALMKIVRIAERLGVTVTARSHSR